MKKMERVQELMEYIRLLLAMQEKGFNCNKEMKDALTALHSEMGFNKIKLDMSSSVKSGTIKIDDDGDIHVWNNSLKNLKKS